ncbi:hypothetical protein E2562_021291 [Oryza meyeriana var. granulata]|uniref:Uncharacterized protein n=1 Tax=Oryza meyeriana var. granulata TaxID=110450 RepID=A0A6G1BY94_9ORYZ|nr:hypothetical protein E2562_021291 [Oryza meyeriana var. granulata]
MAGGGNLFGRVLSYVVNEFIVEGLANNRAFQRFAVRTNKSLENLSSKAKEVREELSEQWRNARGNDDAVKLVFHEGYEVVANCIIVLSAFQHF